MAGRIWRHRLDPDAALHLFRGDRARRLHPPAALRPVDGRAGDLYLRHPRTEGALPAPHPVGRGLVRSEEHTSELQSLMRISYAVFCLKKKTHTLLTTRTLLK